MIRVVVSGTGQMGDLTRATIEAQPDMEVTGIIEPLAEPGATHLYPVGSDPAALFAIARPDVVVDFTNASFSGQLVDAALAAGVRPVIATSGVPREVVDRLREGSTRAGLGAVLAPNMALGAVVLMHLADIAARHFDSVEVIELHHDRKVDAPSGTALETARRMRAARGSDFGHNEPTLQHVEGARGAQFGGVGLHSVRLPGFVAHQEVIFGGQGQTLTLRHDSTGRDSFMPGVLLAVREVMNLKGLVEGLGVLLGLP